MFKLTTVNHKNSNLIIYIKISKVPFSFLLSLLEKQDFLKKELKGEHVTIEHLYHSYQKLVGKATTCENLYYLLARHGWRKVTPCPEHSKKADAQTIVASKNKIYFQEDKKAFQTQSPF